MNLNYYLTVKSIADELELNERTVQNLFRNGILRGKKIARKWVTTKKILDDYIENSE